MLKLILTGLWVCIVTLGAVWFSISRATAPAEHADATPKVETELLKGESISIPMIADGAVQGYFIGRVSFIVDKVKIKGVPRWRLRPRTLLTALLVVFVDCVKELPATMLLRPFNYETLATRVHEKASLENLGDAAPPALLVSAVGLAAVVVLARANLRRR